MNATPMLQWTEAGQPQQARWRSESGAAPCARVQIADDGMPADTAYRLACEGTALLWRGDFQNARLLLQAMQRRIDRAPRSASKKARDSAIRAAVPRTAAQSFHLHRQAQSQRARTLGMLLIPLNGDYTVPLRRAPDLRLACTEAWGPSTADQPPSVVSLRELLGLIGAHEWHRKGVEIPALGEAPNNRIHPDYGVFSPVRGEYVALVAQAPLPAACATAFDIGVGTGVLSAVLARRGVPRIVATDQDPRALHCARVNLQRLGVARQVEVCEADLFPPGRADLVVCNPPWLPGRASSPVERAIYDEGSRMLRGFLSGLASHLNERGEGWLVLSDLAEHLELRTRSELQQWLDEAGLRVLARLDVSPQHGKAHDRTDPLHAARSAEVTSLWRLAPVAGGAAQVAATDPS